MMTSSNSFPSTMRSFRRLTAAGPFPLAVDASSQARVVSAWPIASAGIKAMIVDYLYMAILQR
jgi:hypothetical protein